MASSPSGVNPDYRPLKFIGEKISVEFDVPPALTKRPGCPDRFGWKGETWRVESLISEWHDFSRKGRAAHNMRPEHAATAKLKGSFGVGRNYFRVRAGGGRVFDMYYDRAPKNTEDRAGSWFLVSELEDAERGS